MRLLLLPLVFSLTLSASSILWQKDYAAAQELAQKENKKIFVFISTETCTWCRKLEATTLSDPKIVSRLNGEYVSVHVDKNHSTYPEILKAPVVPMSYFLKSDGTIVDFARGYWDTVDFNLILNDVDKRIKKMEKQP